MGHRPVLLYVTWYVRIMHKPCYAEEDEAEDENGGQENGED